MEKNLSVFISAYRNKYNSQHVLIRLLETWRKNLDKNYVVGAVMIDLSKAFDCIPHDLLIAKLGAYGLNNDALAYIYSYLKGREQAVRVEGKCSAYQQILSGVPQGSVLGPLFFNIFINDLTLFIEKADIHNFADDNTLSAHAWNTEDLKKILEDESNIAIDWLISNDMMANPEKFNAMFVTKGKNDTSGNKLHIKGTEITTENWVMLLGITIDCKLNFDQHISKICKAAAAQLNALIRLKSNLPLVARKALIESYIYSNFNYCPLVWHFSSAASLSKIEKLQERALRFVYNNYSATYDQLLAMSHKCTMEVRRLRTLCLEVFKTINNMNPVYMKEIFLMPKNRHSPRYPLNLAVPKPNQVTFGSRSMSTLAPRVWNALPEHIKSSATESLFKVNIKNWDGSKCVCNVCEQQF